MRSGYRNGARTIVDLGANIGLASRRFLERFPRARIVSVEPEPGNVAVLRHNLDPSADARRSSTHAWSACPPGLPRRDNGSRGRLLHDRRAEGDTDVVTMADVLSELGNDRIDLLKCDIEGAESELFKSSG